MSWFPTFGSLGNKISVPPAETGGPDGYPDDAVLAAREKAAKDAAMQARTDFKNEKNQWTWGGKRRRTRRSRRSRRSRRTRKSRRTRRH
jgi:hypothetical protein